MAGTDAGFPTSTCSVYQELPCIGKLFCQHYQASDCLSYSVAFNSTSVRRHSVKALHHSVVEVKNGAVIGQKLK
jgi:hypothetical protein